MSQDRLAELSGLDRSYISQIENGRVNVSLATIAQIAGVFDRTVTVSLRRKKPPAE